MKRITAILATAVLASSLFTGAAEARGGGGGGHMGGFGGGADIGGLGGGVHMGTLGGERMGGFGGDVGVGDFDGAARIGGVGADRFVGSRLHEHDLHRFDRILPGYDASCDLYMQDPTYPLPPYCD